MVCKARWRRCCAGAVRSLIQAASILAGATLAVQAVVLGASLFQRRRPRRAPADPDPTRPSRAQRGGAWPGGAPLPAGLAPGGPALNPEGFAAAPTTGEPASSVVPYRPPLAAGRARRGAGPGEEPSPGPLSLQTPGADGAGAGVAGLRGAGDAPGPSGNGRAFSLPGQRYGGAGNPGNGTGSSGAGGSPPGIGRAPAAGMPSESRGPGVLAA